MGDKADETIVTMLNAETTGIVTLISLTKDYQSRLEENSQWYVQAVVLMM